MGRKRSYGDRKSAQQIKKRYATQEREDSSPLWGECSVWSSVCAMEMGITPNSLSFAISPRKPVTFPDPVSEEEAVSDDEDMFNDLSLFPSRLKDEDASLTEQIGINHSVDTNDSQDTEDDDNDSLLSQGFGLVDENKFGKSKNKAVFSLTSHILSNHLADTKDSQDIDEDDDNSLPPQGFDSVDENKFRKHNNEDFPPTKEILSKHSVYTNDSQHTENRDDLSSEGFNLVVKNKFGKSKNKENSPTKKDSSKQPVDTNDTKSTEDREDPLSQVFNPPDENKFANSENMEDFSLILSNRPVDTYDSQDTDDGESLLSQGFNSVDEVKFGLLIDETDIAQVNSKQCVNGDSLKEEFVDNIRSFPHKSTDDEPVTNESKAHRSKALSKKSMEDSDSCVSQRTRQSLDKLRKSCKAVEDEEEEPVEDSDDEESLEDVEDPSSTVYHDMRRITRGFLRGEGETSLKTEEKRVDVVGKLVWGYCTGWWPALVVSADHVGMVSNPDKIWVYWVGEGRISQLNVSTQVEFFTMKLEERLLKYLRDRTATAIRSRTSVTALQMLSNKMGCQLTKPYDTWAERNLIDNAQIDYFEFFPYPDDIKKRLDKLKEENVKITQKDSPERKQTGKVSNAANKSNSREESPESSPKNTSPGKGVQKPTTRNSDVRSDEQQTITPGPNILPLLEQKPGAIVWAKLAGYSWWPAMIVDNYDCGTREPNFGCRWVIWYGEYTLSQVDQLKLLKFEEGIKMMPGKKKGGLYVTGVLNASKDYCARRGYNTTEWTMEDVCKWASELEDSDTCSSKSIVSTEKYSQHIAEKLKEIKCNTDVDGERKRTIENSDALKSARIEEGKLEVLCLMCLEFCYNGIQEHPFFDGVLCNKCSEEYKPSVFAYGDDGKCFYCTLCAGSGKVAICDGCDCPRVYCVACLEFLICPGAYSQILLKDPWKCFVCEEDDEVMENAVVRPRSDWRERVVELFRPNRGTDWDQVCNENGKRKKIRVLSLFDGLSTGLLILQKLGIEVENYYASEIDPDAQIVSSAHFGEQIVRLGDVRKISKEDIENIAPIDLLIGGSPCNDLSLVNPNRLGLHDPNGTGILFFEYTRIMELLNAANEGHHLFWLFENVASMPSKFRLEINKYLNCIPQMIDSADFSAMHRPRLYWGNIPITTPRPPDLSQDLQSVLTPNCNRSALVTKIRTVTTKVNSLKQGKELLQPVLMDGEKDGLWITELESIFGFPKHYTDVKNLSATKRQKLIGQSWSVPTLAAIMAPLRSFFKINK